jgi:predicted nucleotidyltransferase
MRTHASGQSALLMLDVADILSADNIPYAVIGAMAAAVHGSVRASLDADAIIQLRVSEAKAMASKFVAAGLAAELRIGDADDPIAALLAITDAFENRVDLLMGLRGMDPAAFTRVQGVQFAGATLRVVSREDFIAMKVFAGGPQDIADAEIAVALDRDSLDENLLRRLADRFGQDAALALHALLRR